MKTLFMCIYKENTGPGNANRGLVEHFDKDIYYIKSQNKILKLFELCFKFFCSKVIIHSSGSHTTEILMKIGHILGKKNIYLMHGSIKHEKIANGLYDENTVLRQENILEKADLILAVSEKFMNWSKKHYPQHKEKLYFLNNGVTKPQEPIKTTSKKRGQIIATGGDRIMKNNIVVSNVVEKMRDVKFKIYGRLYKGNSFESFKNTEYMGQVTQEELSDAMAESELFIVDSLWESFNLSAIDALNCGCSILLSEQTGVTGILELTENDIIYDVYDEDEIKRKIEYLLNNPNNARIVSKLDYDELSFDKAAQKLKRICISLGKDKLSPQEVILAEEQIAKKKQIATGTAAI